MNDENYCKGGNYPRTSPQFIIFLVSNLNIRMYYYNLKKKKNINIFYKKKFSLKLLKKIFLLNCKYTLKNKKC